MLKNEPVGLVAAVNAALLATWGVVVVIAEIGPEVAGSITVMIGAWVGVGGWFVRRLVEPAA
jgi:hypothetical protein